MNAEAMAELRELIVSAKNIADVTNRFLSWWESNDEAPAVGDRIERLGPVRHALDVTLRRLLGRPVELKHETWFRLASHRFVHGSFWIGRRIGQALYFEDLAMGVLCLTDPASGRTDYARFTLLPAPRSDPSEN